MSEIGAPLGPTSPTRSDARARTSLDRIRLGGFKSIDRGIELTFAPLTVICGSNSSGKSTILQSLLLLSQSTTGHAPGQVLALNGPLLTLGTFYEAVHNQDYREAIRLGCSFTAEGVGSRLIGYSAPGVSQPFTVDFDIAISDDPRATPSRLRVDEMVMRISLASQGIVTLSVRRRRGGKPPKRHMPTPTPASSVLTSERHTITVTATGLRPEDDAILDLPQHLAGLDLDGPLPSAMWTGFDPALRTVERILSHPGLRNTRLRAAETGASQEVEDLVLRFWRNDAVRQLLPDRAPDSLTEALEVAQGVPPSRRLGLRNLADEFVIRLRAERRDSELAFERQPLPTPFAGPVLQLRSKLAGLYYLGPLRQAPRPIHSTPAAGGGLRGVGSSGEYTAAVLNRYATEQVNFAVREEVRQLPLREAVNFWMDYLGVHTAAESFDYGKLGHYLLVRDAGVPGPLDLTQVGVGVSQVLPVLVQCLVAPPGSTVLVEQPELHLHPLVQSRLADFMLAVGSAGRTIVCETHSEYFISKLRIATARSETKYGSDYRIYFTERVDGVTVVDEVPVDERGGLPRWPAGFFDQSLEDASTLIALRTQR